ncbi:protein kinase domain-containing protein [Nocardioides pantholopis]|uniref:protein kinase domain-containing protein n=1 Tax=Nocardioides pantholopis TaxID=2483798 RepID=UPI000F084D6F|nr:protein kinase [Nocardioides pantholopis]
MSPSLVLGGRYRVAELLGRGGTADVHRGLDLRSGHWVALKILHRHLAQDPLVVARFRREARVAAGLGHPSIAAFLDTGYDEVPDDSGNAVRVPFIVMEHVAGWSLRDLLRMGGLSPGKAIQYQVGVLAALEFTHRAGVVHRDIKPANVMIAAEGAVKLVDFGIARGSGDPAATMTHARAFLGTPVYLSPEQARGEIADARSDLYSAGCLLFELLTGRPPFLGDDPVSIAYQHVHEEPPRASAHHRDLTPAVDAVLARALAKAREDRFQSARAFTDALRSAARSLVHHDAGARAGALDHHVPMALATGTHVGRAALCG